MVIVMSDYIKREDAIKIINSGISIDTDADKRYVNGLFRAIPSADVAPVRHGHWEVVDAEEPRRYGCSECKRLSWHMENYCPCCGSKMDEEANV